MSSDRSPVAVRATRAVRWLAGLTAVGLGVGALSAVPGPSSAAPAAAAAPAPTAAALGDHDALTLWYDEPATDWETQSLPIGNGAMGANVFGGVATERLTFNEKTLWTGGPGASGYDFGNAGGSRESRIAALQERLWTEGRIQPNEVADILGEPKRGFGSYQVFGDLVLDGLPAASPTDYERTLDIGDAVAGVTYESGGVAYTREYLASHPDNVIAARLSADEPGKVGFTARFEAPNNRSRTATSVAGRMTLVGALNDNGMRYETQVQVVNHGGTLTNNANGTVTVAGADSVDLVLAAGTDFDGEYPDYRTGVAPHAAVTDRVDDAVAAGYAAVRTRHLADFQELFSRVALDIRQTMPDVTTDALLDQYQAGTAAPAAARALEALYFQYGRYLLVASSRPGSLPANLQGVWNNSTSPPWSADYHTNINLQMNYWPAEMTNLSETTGPLFDYIDDMVPAGEVSADTLFGNRGWVTANETNTFGFTGLHEYPQSFWFPEAAAWLTRHYWEHYQYTGDEEFLRERAYPIMRSAAEFWLDELVEDPRDGKLVVAPSYSPENGQFSAGASMSQEIVWDLFSNTTAAGAVVGEDDQVFKAEMAAALADLDPGLRIGSWGQLQEWKTDWDSPSDTHRHVSHLYALHPGNQIQPGRDDEYLDAARVSLTARGDGGTGWSKAWKINFWARLLDGDHSHKMLSELLKGSTLDNLWDTHPPFQIDGNFGATSGVAEMLLQSQRGVVDVLPALPSAWPEGSVSGLKARGDVTVDVDWSAGRATEVTLAAGQDGPLTVSSASFAGPIQVRDGAQVVTVTRDDTEITFEAEAGHEYVVAPLVSMSVSAPAEIEEDVPFLVDVTLDAATAVPATGLALEVPDGWEVDPVTATVPALAADGSATVTFEVVGAPTATGIGRIGATWTGPDWTITGVTSVATGALLPCPAAPNVGPLVAWDPTSGQTVLDSSVFGRNASFGGQQPAYVADSPTGSAANLTGGWLSAGQTRMGYLTAATFATELKITPTSSYRRVWDWKTGGGGDADGVILDLTPSGSMRLITAGQNTGINYQLPSNTWIDLVVTFSEAGAVDVYVNDTRVAGANISGRGVNGCAEPAQLRLGADQGGGQKITAAFDRAAIFPRALSAAEIPTWQSLALDPPAAAEVTAQVTGERTRGWWKGGTALALTTLATETAVTEYRIGEGAWTAYSTPVTLPDGSYAASYRARVGEQVLDEGSRTLRIDGTAPAVSATLAGRTVTVEATDPHSGVELVEVAVDGGAWAPYDGPVVLDGQDHTVASRATDRVGNVSEPETVIVDASDAPVATTAPTVTGTSRVDQVLRATPGTWDVTGVQLAYQWLRNGTPIAGATGTAYRVLPGDVGARLSVRVTAARPPRATGTALSAATAPVAAAGTTTRATAKPRKVRSGKAVQVVVTVRAGSVVPSGTVQVRVGKTVRTVRLVRGRAAVKLRLRGVGTKRITTTYTGSLGYARSSDTVTVKVRR